MLSRDDMMQRGVNYSFIDSATKVREAGVDLVGKLLVNHLHTLQPYLNMKCQTQGDYQIISNAFRTLELTVPLIEHPSEIFS